MEDTGCLLSQNQVLRRKRQQVLQKALDRDRKLLGVRSFHGVVGQQREVNSEAGRADFDFAEPRRYALPSGRYSCRVCASHNRNPYLR